MKGSGGGKLRSTPKAQMEKNYSSQHRDFEDLADVKMQHECGKSRLRLCRTKSIFLVLSFLVFTLFIFSNFIVDPFPRSFWKWRRVGVIGQPQIQAELFETCEDRPRSGKDLLPRGIVQQTSNFEVQPLGRVSRKKVPNGLLAVAAGIKQKRYVDRIVQKFLAHNFTIMLFHYDGVVDKWNELPWSSRAIHVVAINQTKWWFAKRFLHPDIVDPYEYIFVWDEDLGVENFHVDRYLAIMKYERLEISQPALEPNASEVHHRITIRSKRYRVHRYVYIMLWWLKYFLRFCRRSLKPKGTGTLCFENSTDPPCTGWVEGMAPVFTRDAWKCVWHLIQNDLVHGWGMDFKLGYCVKGDRSKSVGVIDSEYIVHRGIPSLGGPAKSKASLGSGTDARSEVRKRSFAELNIFSQRWRNAVKEDECWRDPYKHRTYFGDGEQNKP
ncbi:uncharacterized protein LOC9640521 isoform X2 [Selaginella moellendorffii]|uniref:uncharacterized protein LOC9640521 isoform X2 n=1 Tax=Selaginella moellendorffii TaxID=88036 RepID=UPI000D1C8166|nr:uncharacterized protein LOC9640521 isoform X2 [Selaginella moellendorffii]|eukprot:XP_024532853.1 uncharacterized protein LOC9640521 isoform X2 [Selaginella moellendorffii]